MKFNIKEYFHFTRSETRGIIVLILIIFALLIANKIVTSPHKNNISNHTDFIQNIDQFESFIFEDSIKIENNNLQPFDPNTFNNWEEIGVPKKIAQRIENYKSSGGKFKNSEDLKKIYGLSNEVFLKLEPYIIIESNNIGIVSKPIKKETEYSININTADSLELIKLKGIGTTLAARIIKYRNKLGGYTRIEQLKEVYGISEETYNQFKSSIILDTSSVNKININTCTFKQLNSHPYISYEEAKAIMEVRKFFVFKSISELYKNKVIKEETYFKMEPYLIII